MSCSEDAIQGFLRLEGQLTPEKRTSISTRSYPFVLSVSPRSVPPTLSGSRWIEDTTGTTCTHQQLVYSFIDMHLCHASHPTFTDSSTTASATPLMDLVMTFAPRASNTAGYSAILVFVPVFHATSAAAVRYSSYLDMVWGTTESHVDPAAIPTIQTIFRGPNESTDPQTSYTYSVCVPGLDAPHRVLCMVFPKGIVSANLPSGMEARAKGYPAYQLPASLVNAWGLSSSFSFESRPKSIAVTSEEFLQRLEYFTKPPVLPSEVSTGTTPTVSYKCAPPMNQMKEYLAALDNDAFRQNSVILPGSTTLEQILTERKVMRATQTKGDVPRVDGWTTGQIEGILGAAMAVLVAGVVVLWVGKKATTNSS